MSSKPHRDDESWITCDDRTSYTGDEQYDETDKGTFDIKQWATQYMFTSKLVITLENLGVCNQDDLKFLTADKALMKSLEDTISLHELQRFITAVGALESEENLHGKAADSCPQFDTVTRIAMMEAEIEDLQQASYYKDNTNKRSKESQVREKLNQVRQRKARIDDLERDYLKVASLDFVVAIDCTGSMTPYLAAMKAKAMEMVLSLHSIYPDITYRVAFIGYKDHCDGSQRVNVLAFTDDLSEFTAYVNKMVPCGGCGETADVFGAIEEVAKLQYQGATRVLYHIGDAPCHGREFHHVRADCNPEGDPRGLKAVELLLRLIDQEVIYFFGEINKSTELMIEKFNSIVSQTKAIDGYIQVTPVDGDNVIKVIQCKLTESVISTVSSSSRTDSLTSACHAQSMKNIVVDHSPPDWSQLNAESGMLRQIDNTPTTVEEMVDGEDRTAFADITSGSGHVRVQIAKKPFAKGSSRVAYRALAQYDTNDKDYAVMKETVGMGPGGCLMKAKEVLLCHAVAASLSRMFNDIIRTSTDISLHFVDSFLFQFDNRPDQPYMTWEEPIQGQWEKYNNNSGMCLPCPSLSTGTDHSAVQAFSHWTHSISGGRLMVVDCQGAFNIRSKRFTLTDPAIHCVSLLKYGGTNIGKKGFARFFKTHSCNSICRAIGIEIA